MEFLLVYILTGYIADSGLRYEDAGSCLAEAMKAGTEMHEVGFSLGDFTCVPVAKGKELKLVGSAVSLSEFPLN